MKASKRTTLAGFFAKTKKFDLIEEELDALMGANTDFSIVKNLASQNNIDDSRLEQLVAMCAIADVQELTAFIHLIRTHSDRIET